MHDLDEITLESVPKAGILNILKSLWFPTSTSPTQKSGQIVYGCASLLGEHWDFSFGGILKLREWGVNAKKGEDIYIYVVSCSVVSNSLRPHGL